MDREPGFYWVRDTSDGRWVAAEWWEGISGPYWCYPGSELDYDDGDFAEIGPKIEPPQGGE